MKKHNKKPVIEHLEERVLYSADNLFAGLDLLRPEDDRDAQGSQLLESLELPVIDTETEDTEITAVYVIDTSISNYQDIHDRLSQDSSATIILIDPDESGLDRISTELSLLGSIDELHIFSHGEGDGFRLGDDLVSAENAASHEEAFKAWNSFLSEDADLLLYGCNLATSDAGKSLMFTLADYTGADVASSDNLTGHADFGADWDLEFKTGAIEADVGAIEARMSGWQGILANIQITTTMDTVDGDVSSVSALLDPNSGPGMGAGTDGLISLREAVQAANNTLGQHHTIILSDGTYSLDFTPADPTVTSVPTVGMFDIDIIGDLTIRGESEIGTVISGSTFTNIFDIEQNAIVNLENLTLDSGHGEDSFGGVIHIESGDVTLTHVTVSNSGTGAIAGYGCAYR